MKKFLPTFFYLSALLWAVSLFFGWQGCWGAVRDCELETTESLWNAALFSAPLWLAALTINRYSRMAKVVRTFCLLILTTLFLFAWQIIYWVIFAPLKNPTDGLGIFLSNIFLFRLPFLLAFACVLILLTIVGREVQQWLTRHST